MKTGYEFTLIFVRLWLVGCFIVTVCAIADLAFRRPRSSSRFGHQMLFAVIWPLAILHDKGRRLFFWY